MTEAAIQTDYNQRAHETAAKIVALQKRLKPLQQVFDELKNDLRGVSQLNGNVGFTIDVPGEGRVTVKKAVERQVLGTEYVVNQDKIAQMSPQRLKRLLDEGFLEEKEKVRNPRSAQVEVRLNV